ncbi:hypothetical protein [uncultured Winogradskyella sp.]|uniref:hypothetical protein n=1 Tax=uncultured Winogradskyella sp. TaxID=395353 RepID=UPI0030D8DC25
MNSMRKLILLLGCLLWTCTVISQDLKPILQDINSEQYFCFTIEQSRFVAKRLEFSLFQDSIIDTLKIRNLRWQHLLHKKDTIIFKLEDKVENLVLVKENDKVQIQELNLTIRKQNKRIKRGKLERWFFGGGLLILTGIIIAQ